jgi:hypothetical protein
MQFKFKPLAPIVTAIFIFLSQISFAQHWGMAAARANMNTQFINQQMRTQMMMMGSNWRSNAGYGPIYTVTFKDSSQTEIPSYIYRDSLTHKSFLVFVNTDFPKSDSAHRWQKIYPDQTIRIESYVGNDDEIAIGKPTDSCWSFRMTSGPLFVFASDINCLTEKNDLDQRMILGIQLYNGPMEKYTEENLIKMIDSDPKVAELLNKKQFYKAIKRFNKDAFKATGK